MDDHFLFSSSASLMLSTVSTISSRGTFSSCQNQLDKFNFVRKYILFKVTDFALFRHSFDFPLLHLHNTHLIHCTRLQMSNEMPTDFRTMLVNEFICALFPQFFHIIFAKMPLPNGICIDNHFNGLRFANSNQLWLSRQNILKGNNNNNNIMYIAQLMTKQINQR